MVSTPLSTLGQTIERLIERHGTTITVTRTTRVRSGGGFVTTTTGHGPYRVLVTERRASPVKIVTPDPGTTRNDPGWVALFPPNTPVLATVDVIDRFTVPGLGTFRVREIRTALPYGETAGVIADLEREG